MNLENCLKILSTALWLKTLRSYVTPIRPHVYNVMINTVRAYANSGWLTDFGKHFCSKSSPFRHTSVRFANFYKHFCSQSSPFRHTSIWFANFYKHFLLWAALLSPFRHTSTRFAYFLSTFCDFFDTHAACHSNPSVYTWRHDKNNTGLWFWMISRFW